MPQLLLHGIRDTLVDFEVVKKVCRKLDKATLVKIEGGDYAFKMLKSTGATHETAIEQLAQETARFAAGL